MKKDSHKKDNVAQKLGTNVRKQQIAQAALGLVSSHGLPGLSIAGIARRVGLVPSAVYRHFKNKDQVIDALLDLIHARLLGNVKVITEETADPLERLQRLLLLHIQLLRENQGILRLVFSQEVMNGQPERKSKIRDTVAAYLGAIGDLVQQGQGKGVIRADLEAGAIAVAFLGMIQPAAIIWHLSEGNFDLACHAQRAWNIFLTGIV